MSYFHFGHKLSTRKEKEEEATEKNFRIGVCVFEKKERETEFDATLFPFSNPHPHTGTHTNIRFVIRCYIKALNSRCSQNKHLYVFVVAVVVAVVFLFHFRFSILNDHARACIQISEKHVLFRLKFYTLQTYTLPHPTADNAFGEKNVRKYFLVRQFLPFSSSEITNARISRHRQQ